MLYCCIRRLFIEEIGTRTATKIVAEIELDVTFSNSKQEKSPLSWSLLRFLFLKTKDSRVEISGARSFFCATTSHVKI